MHAVFHHSINDIPADQWDALWPSDYPFTRHAFLAALENSNSIDIDASDRSGWQVAHLTLEHMGQVVAGVPLFVKYHSYGEYVFDWSWASAYEQARMPYYPKLINAIPFTPATGPRFAISTALPDELQAQCTQQVFAAIARRQQDEGYSGFHCLFPEKSTASALATAGFERRLGYQFHWFNQDFRDFDHFLASFSSRKRKNINKERHKVFAQDLEIKTRHAEDIREDEWDGFYRLYQTTYLKRSGHGGYLGADFFHRVARALPKQVILVSAHQHKHMIAAALYFRDSQTLYGRYWGSEIDIDGLHFECCYYRGIEYAIAQGKKRFDPGAQGEHKIQRGFTPIKTQSFHSLSHPGFQQAIGDFCVKEGQHIEHYIRDAREMLPFKQDAVLVDQDIII